MIHAVDRKTRLAACEFLHACTVFLVGASARLTPEMQAKRPFTQLFRNIFPLVVNLAADCDEVVRQLFHTLLIQVFISF